MAVIDHVQEAAKTLRGGDFGRGDQPPGAVGVLVRYAATDARVWVRDDGVRPPAPGGQWLEDRISAACRLLFGCDRGRCRPVPGGDGRLEFREAWPDPDWLRVHASPRITIHPCPKFPRGHSTLINVRTKALAGADHESVILASAQQYAEFRIGPGVCRWVPNRPSELEYVAGEGGRTPEIRFRHTVIRPGGQAAELVTGVAPDVANSWPGVFAAVAANARKRFGPGRLKYEPELGETFFTYEE